MKICDSPILEHHNSQSRVTSEFFPRLSCMRLEGRVVHLVCHHVVGKWRVCLTHYSTHDPAWCKKEQMSGFISTAFRTLLGYHFDYLSTELIKLNYSFLIRLCCNKQTLVYVRGLLSILSTKVHHMATFMLGSSMLSVPAVSVALICKLIGIFPRIIIHRQPRLGFQEHVVSIFLICWLQTLSFQVPILLCIIGDVIYSPNFAHLQVRK